MGRNAYMSRIYVLCNIYIIYIYQCLYFIYIYIYISGDILFNEKERYNYD